LCNEREASSTELDRINRLAASRLDARSVGAPVHRVWTASEHALFLRHWHSEGVLGDYAGLARAAGRSEADTRAHAEAFELVRLEAVRSMAAAFETASASFSAPFDQEAFVDQCAGRVGELKQAAWVGPGSPFFLFFFIILIIIIFFCSFGREFFFSTPETANSEPEEPWTAAEIAALEDALQAHPGAGVSPMERFAAVAAKVPTRTLRQVVRQFHRSRMHARQEQAAMLQRQQLEQAQLLQQQAQLQQHQQLQQQQGRDQSMQIDPPQPGKGGKGGGKGKGKGGGKGGGKNAMDTSVEAPSPHTFSIDRAESLLEENEMLLRDMAANTAAGTPGRNQVLYASFQANLATISARATLLPGMSQMPQFSLGHSPFFMAPPGGHPPHAQFQPVGSHPPGLQN
jgi:hypothetical protein